MAAFGVREWMQLLLQRAGKREVVPVGNKLELQDQLEALQKQLADFETVISCSQASHV